MRMQLSGRASPCQGECREFESLHPLSMFVSFRILLDDNFVMTKAISIEDLKGLITKPYGTDAPTKQKWAEFYNENVIFTDPTQETEGLDSYVKAQEKLVKR